MPMSSAGRRSGPICCPSVRFPSVRIRVQNPVEDLAVIRDSSVGVFLPFTTPWLCRRVCHDCCHASLEWPNHSNNLVGIDVQKHLGIAEENAVEAQVAGGSGQGVHLSGGIDEEHDAAGGHDQIS